MIANTPATPSTTTPSTPENPLDKYKLLALEALADIIRDTESSPRDRRLASTAILKYVAAAESAAAAAQRARPEEPDRPLTLEEAREEARIRQQENYETYNQSLIIAYERGYDDARNNVPCCPVDSRYIIQEDYRRMQAGLDAFEEDSPPTPDM